jgi:hypothetical protein
MGKAECGLRIADCGMGNGKLRLTIWESGLAARRGEPQIQSQDSNFTLSILTQSSAIRIPKRKSALSVHIPNSAIRIPHSAFTLALP